MAERFARGGRLLAVGASQHIPRIQEAQASAYHALRELGELAGP
jgi:hypothetical protein